MRWDFAARSRQAADRSHSPHRLPPSRAAEGTNREAMKTRKCRHLLICALALVALLASVLPPAPTAAAQAVGKVETCDSPALPGWQVSSPIAKPVTIIDGACALDPSGAATYQTTVLDFRLRLDGAYIHLIAWLADRRMLVNAWPDPNNNPHVWLYDPRTARWTELGELESLSAAP